MKRGDAFSETAMPKKKFRSEKVITQVASWKQFPKASELHHSISVGTNKELKESIRIFWWNDKSATPKEQLKIKLWIKRNITFSQDKLHILIRKNSCQMKRENQ